MLVLTAKLPSRTLVLSPARSRDCPPAKSADRSWEKGVLQADAELIQFHRHNADERTGKKAFQEY